MITPNKILIVDDTPKNIQILGTVLRQQQYQIYVAQNGRQALEVAHKVIPDLVLLDIMMPEMDGFQACEELKKSAVTSKIPIIFLTAKAEAEDIVKGFELGAVDYILKPFNSAELLARVRTHLLLVQKNRELAQSAEEQKELLHILCHDLANPLTACSGASEILDHDNYEALKDIIHSAAQNGLEIIKLVRQMRAVEDKPITLSPVKVSEAVYQSKLILQPKFTAKNIELVTKMNPDIRVYVEPISFINSVLNNLFTNAIKFSHPNSIILITVEPAGEQVKLMIEDHGIGMPQSLVSKLFDIKQPTSRRGTQGEDGTGFGMPLVKKFITAYGGSIQVSSVDEREDAIKHGTAITLLLPASA